MAKKKEAGFTPVPNPLLDALFSRGRKLSPSAWTVLMYIIRFTYGFHAGDFGARLPRTRIARGTGLTSRSVERALRDLENLGIVEQADCFSITDEEVDAAIAAGTCKSREDYIKQMRARCGKAADALRIKHPDEWKLEPDP